ncbi:Type II secretion system protein F [Novipirellula aureliae]|uniref:Type II secretion system protein F n=1 Tax=Novipirellula aureliae TaxID=2527966 RepID=A0A5C6DJX4_9BACT|nr:type II secretion system F family protein [Novipirellula aureliae]TWU36545.1 Type II secretion system protein F [Novipirellula aureliae]
MKLSAAQGFCYRFGTGIKAGADLLVLLKSEAGYGSPRQRSAMLALRDGAKDGQLLSKSMKAEHPFFPPLLIAMTRVGEATGRLERSLLALANLYQHRLMLKRKFLTSLAWPGLQAFGGLMAISLLIWLLGVLTPPTGGEMFDTLGFGLRGTSGVLQLWAYVGIFFVIIGGMIWAFFRNLGGVQNIIPILYLIPVVGPALQTITLSRFCWTLSLALDAGLDPIRSIDLALDSTDSDYYRGGSDLARDAILGGATLSGGLKATNLFPEEFLTQVEISEISGTDAESIDRLAAEYDEKAKSAVSTISAIATGLIWLSVIVVLVFLILRMAMRIFGGYAEALEPI